MGLVDSKTFRKRCIGRYCLIVEEKLLVKYKLSLKILRGKQNFGESDELNSRKLENRVNIIGIKNKLENKPTNLLLIVGSVVY